MLNWITRRARARTPIGPVALPAGQAHRLRLRAGDVLLVRQGRVWMTREGDPLDHLLTPTQGHVAACPQDVVLESCVQGGSLYERQTLAGHVNFSLSTFRLMISRMTGVHRRAWGAGVKRPDSSAQPTTSKDPP